MSSLGERLLYVRCSIGMTAKSVKEKTGISDLGRFEKDERKPSIDTILAIANFYNVSTDWLLTGEGEMYRDPAAPLPAEPAVGNALPALSADERHLLQSFNKLNEREKGRILGRIDALVEVQEAAAPSLCNDTAAPPCDCSLVS